MGAFLRLPYAELVELADTPDLGSGSYRVRVRVPYSAFTDWRYIYDLYK